MQEKNGKKMDTKFVKQLKTVPDYNNSRGRKSSRVLKYDE